uniref:Uncharacterized protein n=1 Tax=Klebsiella pneumoniae subsp. pneumoniae TaxID=72407 RepID=A0A0S2TJR9_KLEPN|nr:hypothetical protein KPH11_390 [Klebsiella pneumoniae subsp. pneumoniae]
MQFRVHNLTRTSGNMSYAAADRGSHQFKVASNRLNMIGMPPFSGSLQPQ